MKSPHLLLAIGAVILLLTGCAQSLPEGAASTPSASVSVTPRPTPTLELPRPAAVILSLEGITVVDAGGTTLESAVFADANAMLALITELVGPPPAVDDQFLAHKGFLTYEWPGLTLTVSGGTAAGLGSDLPDLAGLPLRTTEGIHVGSTRADVEALNPIDTGYDGDGDGKSDSLGLEQQTVPDVQSLSFPGQPGTAYVNVRFEGDTVTHLGAPSGDFYDI